MMRTAGAERRAGAIGTKALAGVCVLLFAASATVTTAASVSMSAMGEMPMPGGWTMSMTWVRMPGQTWPGTAASFLGMWVVMMVAMMLPSLLPSLLPMLWRHRQTPRSTWELPVGLLTALVALGYFFIWTAIGVIIFPFGAGLTAIVMDQPTLARLVPIAAGVVIVGAGSLQLTAWKARRLACCREAIAHVPGPPTGVVTAWRQGLRLGLHCCCCCANLMAILMVIGVMDLRAMAVVTVALTAERLAPAGEGVARTIGIVAIAAGVLLIVQAASAGSL